MFNPVQSAREAAASIPDATFTEIPSLQGHQAAATASPSDGVFLNTRIAQFLGA